VIAPVRLLVFALLLVACGPSTRQQTLRTVYIATTAAQAGFVAWDGAHSSQIAKRATSLEEGVRELEAYTKARSPVVQAFEVVYRSVAAAALIDEDQKSLIAAVGAFEQLRFALRTLTGGKLP